MAEAREAKARRPRGGEGRRRQAGRSPKSRAKATDDEAKAKPAARKRKTPS